MPFTFRPPKAGLGEVLKALRAAPEEFNPALTLATRLRLMNTRGRLDLHTLERMEEEIGETVAEGERELERVDRMRKSLAAAPAVPLEGKIPLGF